MSTPGNTSGDAASATATDDTKKRSSPMDEEQDENGDKKKGNKRKRARVKWSQSCRTVVHIISILGRFYC